MRKFLCPIIITAIIAIILCFVVEEKVDCSLFELNVEALSESESQIPTIPCIQAVSRCTYLIKDTSGNIYQASTTGMRNVY